MPYINTATIYFTVAFVGIITMISSKHFGHSLKTSRTDHFFSTAYLQLKKFFSYFNRKSAIALMELIAFHILSWAHSLYKWMRSKAHAHPPSKKVIDMVRGRGRADRNGGASFYLKNISEKGEGNFQ